jgi:hypothetical protein
VFDNCTGFPDSVCYFLQRLAHTRFCRFLFLLVYGTKVFYWTFQRGCGIFKLIPLCSVRPLLCHLPVVLKISPWGHVWLSFSALFKFGYQIIRLLSACSWRRMRYNGGDVIAYALGNFLPLW